MLNLSHLLASVGPLIGLALIALVVFAESGVLAGFFLPGDTLLFTAGFFAEQGKLPLGWVIIVAALAAMIGDNVGYEIGKRLGPRLFKKPNSILFRQDNLKRAEAFYEKHGGKTVIMARFVPYIRTLAPVVAGASHMPHKRFTLFNVFGGAFWAASVTLLGFWLGKKLHVSIDHYILPVVAIAVILQILPIAWHLLHDRETRRRLALALHRVPKILRHQKD